MADKVEIGKFKVNVLTSKNYFVWSTKIELLLRWKKIWTIVNGDEAEPTIDEHRADKISTGRFRPQITGKPNVLSLASTLPRTVP